MKTRNFNHVSMYECPLYSKQRSIAIFVIIISLSVLVTIPSCQPQKIKIIRQVDHVLIASNDAEGLFTLLSDTLELPIVWPMANYGRITSGGVAAGNVNLEIVKMPVVSEDGAISRFIGMAFEPEPLEPSLLELDAREINHGAAVPLTTLISDGTIATLWTTVLLPDLSNQAMIIFLCEYTHDVAAQRRESLDQLVSRNGGPLSVDSVKEIVIGTTDMERNLDLWQNLLNPLSPPSPGFWQLESGPAIRFVQADNDGIQALIIDVNSLSQARQFLVRQGLLGEDNQNKVTLDGVYLQGLNIKLAEKDW